MQLAKSGGEVHVAIRRHRARGDETQRIAERLDDAPAGTTEPRIDADDANRGLHEFHPMMSVRTLPAKSEQNKNIRTVEARPQVSSAPPLD
ncbi:hypothetical protein D3C87_1790980 [compost metagenome]